MWRRTLLVVAWAKENCALEEFNQNPEVIITLLKAGADAKAKNNKGYTAFDYAQDSEKVKDTDSYRQLQEASQ